MLANFELDLLFANSEICWYKSDGSLQIPSVSLNHYEIHFRFKMRASSIFSLVCLLPFAYGSPPLRSIQPIFETSEEIISKSRLPDSFVPNFYSVELQVILDEGKNGTEFTAPGKVAIHGACLRPLTDNITLHALGLDIKDESIKVIHHH